MGDGDETCPSSRLDSGMLTKELVFLTIFSHFSKDLFAGFNEQITMFTSF